MAHLQPAGLLLTSEDYHLVSRLLTMAEQQGRRTGGVPVSDNFVRLKAQVEAAIAAERTLRGHEKQADRYRHVSTAEYAQLRGVDVRTARRHAEANGFPMVKGHYQIPIEKD